VNSCCTGTSFHLGLSSIRVALAQVLVAGNREQQGALGDITDPFAQGGQVIICERPAVKQDLPLAGLVEGQDQADQAGLADAAWANDGNVFLVLDKKGDLLEDGFCTGIGKGDPIKNDVILEMFHLFAGEKVFLRDG
jgi:hypothetical protein